MWNLAFITDVLSLIFIVAGALQVFFASVAVSYTHLTLPTIYSV